MSFTPCMIFEGESMSATYAKFRPTPPLALINKIISYVKEKIPGDLEKAADVGCGTGQSTQILQPFFHNIAGFDISESQVNEARKQNKDMPNITYCTSPAETLPVADQSLQLVTVSQAVHYFNLPEFFKEVHRILVPNGVCAIYSYLLPLLTPEDPTKTKEVHELVNEFFGIMLRRPESKEKQIWNNIYKDSEIIPEKYFTDIIREDSIVHKEKTTLEDFCGFLNSVPAYQCFKMEEPEEDKKLEHVVGSITNIIGDENQDPSNIPLSLENKYVLLMARKKE